MTPLGVVSVCGVIDPSSNYVEILPTSCPKCGGELDDGFGFAFGGFGPYVMCSAKGCDFHAKRLVTEE